MQGWLSNSSPLVGHPDSAQWPEAHARAALRELLPPHSRDRGAGRRTRGARRNRPPVAPEPAGRFNVTSGTRSTVPFGPARRTRAGETTREAEGLDGTDEDRFPCTLMHWFRES